MPMGDDPELTLVFFGGLGTAPGFWNYRSVDFWRFGGASRLGEIGSSRAHSNPAHSNPGHSQPAHSNPAQKPPLRRAQPNSGDMPAPVLMGVCSGLSIHTGISVTLLRWLMAGSCVFFGAGAVLYLWLAVTVPLDSLGTDAPAQPAAARLRKPLARLAPDHRSQTVAGQLLVAGGVLLTVATVIFIGTEVFAWSVVLMSSGAAIIGGLILLWSQIPKFVNGRSPRVWLSSIAGVFLILGGIFLFLSRDYPPRTLLLGGIIGALVATALVISVAPIWVGMISAMTAARSREVREAERADIAAHLHDSVLQTLTLVRAAADDPVKVRSLALTQERELRSWLYTGVEDAGQSVTKLLHERVGALETAHGVEVSVVTVGDTAPGPYEQAAVAAAGEAIANAVRHGSPPISVFVEVSDSHLDIYVKDGGSGFDLADIPADRHGIRESIVGRVQRVGGKTEIRSAETGTEVRIQVPLTAPETNTSPNF